jgi:Calpain family cysteine protease
MTEQVPSTGVPSPYALAELIARRKIDWSEVPNRPQLLEEILQTPYEELFDPAHGSLLYLDWKHEGNGKYVRSKPDFKAETERDVYPAASQKPITNLAELVKAIGEKHLAESPVRAVANGRGGRLLLELGETPGARRFRQLRLLGPELIDALFPILAAGYHPPGMSWTDMGRFYNEAAEFFDPVQGAVGDCYLIAALSSVAWSKPYTISDAARATGSDNEAFKHQVTFYEAGQPKRIEVSEKLLKVDGGGVTFCRSSEDGEVWPGVYEKAYAKLRLGVATDFPAIPDIAGGDPVGACAQLTGLAPTYMWHSSFTAAQVLNAVRTHSSNGRTTSPITAWTHGSGAEGDVAYRDANVVAGHAYSILGWMRRYEFRPKLLEVPVLVPEIVPPFPDPGPLLRASGLEVATQRFSNSFLLDRLQIEGVVPVDYLIVRNPWGYFEGTGPSTASGAHQAIDVDWWRTIPLGTKGVFAMEVNSFHRYFAGIGYVS